MLKNWHLQPTIVLRSLPQCGECDLVWEERLLLMTWAWLKIKDMKSFNTECSFEITNYKLEKYIDSNQQEEAK